MTTQPIYVHQLLQLTCPQGNSHLESIIAEKEARITELENQLATSSRIEADLIPTKPLVDGSIALYLDPQTNTLYKASTKEVDSGEMSNQPDNSKISLFVGDGSAPTVLGEGNETHHAGYAYRVTNFDSVPADLTLTLEIKEGTLTESVKHQILEGNTYYNATSFALEGTAKYPFATTLTATLTRKVNGVDVVIDTHTQELAEGLF